jgi:hypothetical protein
VILGFEQISAQLTLVDDELSMEELPIEDADVNPNTSVIERSIEFPKEYYQAGIGILSYFGEVLKHKHPDVKAKVRIEQDGLLVRMHIESATGDRETIEQTLEDYARVVKEEATPSSLLEDKIQIAALEQKLDMAKLEVKHAYQLLQLTEGNFHARVLRMEDEVGFLRKQVGLQISQVDAQRAVTEGQMKSTERILLAQIKHSDLLVTDLLGSALSNKSVSDALLVIIRKLEGEVGKDDDQEIKQALVVIKDEAPTIWEELGLALQNVVYGVAGNYVFELLKTIPL